MNQEGPRNHNPNSHPPGAAQKGERASGKEKKKAKGGWWRGGKTL